MKVLIVDSGTILGSALYGVVISGGGEAVSALPERALKVFHREKPDKVIVCGFFEKLYEALKRLAPSACLGLEPGKDVLSFFCNRTEVDAFIKGD